MKEIASMPIVRIEWRVGAFDRVSRRFSLVTERAREKGVSISVITIKGTTCLLPVIGQMVMERRLCATANLSIFTFV